MITQNQTASSSELSKASTRGFWKPGQYKQYNVLEHFKSSVSDLLFQQGASSLPHSTFSDQFQQNKKKGFHCHRSCYKWTISHFHLTEKTMLWIFINISDIEGVIFLKTDSNDSWQGRVQYLKFFTVFGLLLRGLFNKVRNKDFQCSSSCRKWLNISVTFTLNSDCKEKKTEWSTL